jgi:hypothetical protein
MNDQCRLIKSLSTRGPAPVPLSPCCMAALIALQDRDRPDTVWLCPFEERGPFEDRGLIEERDPFEERDWREEEDSDRDRASDR